MLLGPPDGSGDDRHPRAGANGDHHTAGGVGWLRAAAQFAGAFLAADPIPARAGFLVGASAPVFPVSIGALYHCGRTGSSLAKQMAQSIVIQAADLRRW